VMRSPCHVRRRRRTAPTRQAAVLYKSFRIVIVLVHAKIQRLNGAILSCYQYVTLLRRHSGSYMIHGNSNLLLAKGRLDRPGVCKDLVDLFEAAVLRLDEREVDDGDAHYVDHKVQEVELPP